MLRKILYVLAGVLTLLVVVAVFVIMTVDPDDYREDIAERAGKTLGREVRLEGPLSLRLLPRISLEIRELSVANPPAFDAAPALAKVGSASVTVAVWPLIRGELEVGTLTLRDATLSLVTNADGASNLEGLLAEPSAETQSASDPDLSGLSLAGLEIEDVSVQMIDLATDETVRAQINEFTLGAFRPGQIAPLSLRADLLDERNEQQTGLSMQAGLRVAADLGRIDLEDVVAGFEMPSGDLAGEVSAGLSVDLSGAAPLLQLQDLSATIDLAQRSLRLDTAETLAIELGDPISAQFQALELALEDQPLALSGSFSLGDSLVAELAVSGPELDLRPWLGTAEPTAQAEGTSSSQPIDFAPLIGPRLTLELELGRLVLADDLILREVQGQALLRDGLVRLEPMEAQSFGGRFHGLVTIDFNAAPPQLQVSPQLTGIEVQQLVRLLNPVAPLRGLGELNLDFRFSGLSAAEILASLDGEGRFSLQEGALLGVDLQRLIEEEITTSNLSSIQQAFGGETPFRTLTGRVRAESGVLFLPDMNLQADGFGLTGGGEMDLAAGKVAYQLELALDQALIDRLPRALARATDGVIPLTVAGPVNRPLVRVDLAALAEGAVQRQLQDQLFERLAPQEEPETPSDPEGEQEAESGERSSETLLRALRERRQREEPPPDEPPER